MLDFLFRGMHPLYSADGGAGSGGSGDGSGTGGNGDNTPGGGGNPTDSQPFAVFPDKESFMSRVNREAKKLVKEQISELGFEKVEDLKTSLEGFKTIESEYNTAKTTFQTTEDSYKQSLSKANEKLMQYEVKLQAIGLGIIDPEVAYSLMDKSKVEMAEDGSITGVKEALEALLEEKQYLRGTTKSSGGADFSGGNGDNQTLTMEVIKGMSQEEVARRLPEINAFLAGKK